jgi:hypothetical protein
VIRRANPFGPAGERAANLSRKRRVGPAAEKSQHVIRREVLDGMVHERGIEGVQRRGIAKQHIGRIFTLSDGPVVAAKETRVAVQPRVDGLRQPVEHRSPPTCRKLIGEGLCAWQITHGQDGILHLGVRHAGVGQLLGEPVAPVDTDLDSQRQPRLQADVEEPEVAIPIIEVQVQALALAAFQAEPTRLPVTADGERPTWLDAGEDAD